MAHCRGFGGPGSTGPQKPALLSIPPSSPEQPPSALPVWDRAEEAGSRRALAAVSGSPWCLSRGGGLICPPDPKPEGAGQGRTGPRDSGSRRPPPPPGVWVRVRENFRGKARGTLTASPRPRTRAQAVTPERHREAGGCSWGTGMCPPRGTGHCPATRQRAEPHHGVRARGVYRTHSRAVSQLKQQGGGLGRAGGWGAGVRSKPPCRTGVNSGRTPARGRQRPQPRQVRSEQRPEEAPAGRGRRALAQGHPGTRGGTLGSSHGALPRPPSAARAWPPLYVN